MEPSSEFPNPRRSVKTNFEDLTGKQLTKANLSDPLTFTKVARALRPNETGAQAEFFTNLVDRTHLNLPNPSSVGQFLADVNTIPWLTPQPDLDSDRIAHNINQHLEVARHKLMQVRIIKGGLIRVANEQGWAVGWDATQRPALGWRRYDAYQEVQTLAKAVADDGITDSGVSILDYYRSKILWHIQFGSTWPIVEDLISKYNYRENPFSYIMEVYRMGAWPIGIEHKRRFLVGPDYSRFNVLIPKLQNTK